MGTDRWHFWGHTDHQGTLIIREKCRSLALPYLHAISCDWTQLIT
ncbi:unnamed protein product [Staurois parvus]|uniref:Uncharacterized protein n=1 Tax=Staurois parvus TaxID=386267 RepID=A0ABN9FPL6_9NEOB|nr:unnamed protein product [Staurois parvus]